MLWLRFALGLGLLHGIGRVADGRQGPIRLPAGCLARAELLDESRRSLVSRTPRLGLIPLALTSALVHEPSVAS